MAEMMKKPKVVEKAQTELRRILKGKRKVTGIDLKKVIYQNLVIKETQRLHPPLPLLLSKRMQGALCIVNAWAINRDAEFWEDSESFTPERFKSNSSVIIWNLSDRILSIYHLAISFGLSNVELLLAQLIYHFNWKLPNEMKPEDVDVTETPGFSCSRKYNLCVIATSNNHGI
ncbi:hypothetical protein RDI58_005542 [Solanum bulbocastanum]|uniref:Uncharacterized protein n=1 Tax=Solanum bulbocastanum TaxID=147425 RepID=A0AAN8U0W5_SOLBU